MRDIAIAIGSLVYQNPFLPERIETERAILGDDFVADTSVWSRDVRHESRPNIAAIGARAEQLVKRIPRGPHYEDLATYVLYDRWSERFLDVDGKERVAFYDDFAADARQLLTDAHDLPHLFAC